MPIALAYEGRGQSGPPLILVHGFPLDRSMWRGQLEGLSSVARVVAVDLPGFGASPPAVDAGRALTIDALADHVVALAESLGMDRFILGGLSMGGYVALAAARRHRAHIMGLALIDTKAEPDTPEARKLRLDTAERVLKEGSGFLIDKQLGMMLSPRTLAERTDLAAGAELMMRRVPPQTVAAALRGLAERRDARPDLQKIDVPTVVVVGADDTITPPPGARALAASIRGAQLAVIANAGHMAPFEQPTACNVALRRLVRKVAARR